MARELLTRVLVPIADPDDAIMTARALHAVIDPPEEVIVGHVIEKASGAPDKASVAQRQELATDLFDAFLDTFQAPEHTTVRCVTLYGRDVVETIVDAAEQAEATAIVFAPRAGGRLVKLISGDIALHLVQNDTIPVVTIPDVTADAT